MAWTIDLPSGRVRGGYRTSEGRKVQRAFDYECEAREWAEEQEAEDRARANLPAAPVITVAPATEPAPTITEQGAAWLRRKATKAKSTTDGYACHLRAIERSGLGAQHLDEVLKEDVEEWMVDQLEAGDGRPSVNARLKVLRMVYRDAHANRKVAHDPTDGVDFLATDTTPHRVYTDAEQAALLLACGDDASLRTMVLLGLEAGLRWQEVAAMTPAAVVWNYDPKTGQEVPVMVHVFQVVERSTHSVRAYPKGHRDRYVPVGGPRLRAALAAEVKGKAADALLFTSAEGCLLTYWKYRLTVWRPLCHRAGVSGKGKPRARFHDLRHTFGTTCAMRGVPRALIAKWMGHADEKTTAIYINPTDVGLDVAKAVFDRPTAPAALTVVAG